ncbi:MAG TPA: type II toxin-antitoxin system HicB family antitoxin [Chloroflexota bacterium]|nr:type II toxin-antitoxin system HicB family antitoxin [Chloroflexota bacterium]
MHTKQETTPAGVVALSTEYGMIGGYHIVYEQLPRNWSAYSPDAPGCMATARTRQALERQMSEALTLWAEDNPEAVPTSN